LDIEEHQGKIYFDIPGLSDLVLRQQAAEAIDKALQAGGDFQVAFFTREDEGRLRNDDITTMKLVLDATKGQVTEDHFAIVVNMCDEELIAEMKKIPGMRDGYMQTIKEVCARRKMPFTKYVHFAPRIPELRRKINVVVPLAYELETFLDAAPVLRIDETNVEDVKHQEFEEALQAAAEASRAAEIACKEAERAEVAKQEALRGQQAEREAKEEAEKKAEIARKETERAEEAEQEAEKKAEIARKETERAEVAEQEALRRQQAEQVAKEEAKKKAKEETKKAQEAEERASNEEVAKEEAKKKAQEAEERARNALRAQEAEQRARNEEETL